MEDQTLHQIFEKERESLSPEEWRFLLDLEFVQSLSNPDYLKFIALHEEKFLQNENFHQFLKYLLYWKEPRYSKFITYPHCLFILEMLQDEHFRSNLNSSAVIACIYEQQHLHWRFYRMNRMNSSIEVEPKKDMEIEQPTN